MLEPVRAEPRVCSTPHPLPILLVFLPLPPQSSSAMNALLIWLECHWEWWLALGHVAGAHWLTLPSLLKIAWSTSQFGQFCGLSKSTWWTICHLPLEVPSLFCFPVWSSFSVLLFFIWEIRIFGGILLLLFSYQKVRMFLGCWNAFG